LDSLGAREPTACAVSRILTPLCGFRFLFTSRGMQVRIKIPTQAKDGLEWGTRIPKLYSFNSLVHL
jgi:hypothetical protein